MKRVEQENSTGDFDKYWEPIEAGTGSIPQIYLSLGEADRRAVREEVETQLSRFASNGKLVMSVEMLIGSGSAPDNDPHVGKSDALRDLVQSETLELTEIDDQRASLDYQLLEILCCPVTNRQLEYDIVAGELISRTADLAFPIRDGIPIMLRDAARKLGG